MFSYLLFLHPSIVVYILVEPIDTYFPLYIKSYPPINYSSPFRLNKSKSYIPYKSIIVIVSSISPVFNTPSYFVFALMLGPPLTSSSQALPAESKMKSNPYN